MVDHHLAHRPPRPRHRWHLSYHLRPIFDYIIGIRIISRFQVDGILQLIGGSRQIIELDVVIVCLVIRGSWADQERGFGTGLPPESDGGGVGPKVRFTPGLGGGVPPLADGGAPGRRVPALELELVPGVGIDVPGRAGSSAPGTEGRSGGGPDGPPGVDAPAGVPGRGGMPDGGGPAGPPSSSSSSSFSSSSTAVDAPGADEGGGPSRPAAGIPRFVGARPGELDDREEAGSSFRRHHRRLRHWPY